MQKLSSEIMSQCNVSSLYNVPDKAECISGLAF